MSLGNLLASLRPEVSVTVIGVDPAVVGALAARRPATRSRVLPPVAGKLDLRSMLAHVRAVRKERPEILHTSLRTPWSCQYGILAGLVAPGVRVVCVEQLPIPSPSRLQRAIRRFLAGRVAGHVAVGDRAARLVERFVGLPERSVGTIYNGVPDLEAEPMARRRPGPIIGTLGRLDPQKGFDLLIRALPLVPDATVVIVGDGPERAGLERLARELGVTDRVLITGWSEQARAYLGSFDIFVLPSRFEGFPLSIVEAMLARLPVVATDVGSIAEAVLDGETGFLVPAEDVDALAGALQRLLADPELRRRLGESGRARALDRFTAATMARSFERLYEEVTRGGKPPARSRTSNIRVRGR